MLKSFKDRADVASPGVVGHIQIGRIQKRQTKYGDKLMGGKTDHILVTTAVKDAQIAGAFVLDDALMLRIWGRDLPKSPFGSFGKSHRLRIFTAGDTLEDTFDTDRALFLSRVRSCYSRDGVVAEWNPGAKGEYKLPEVMRQHVTGESGGRAQLKCLESNCPLVIDPIRMGKSLYKCKGRATLLARIEGAGSGIYDFDTTSEISGDQIIAMLSWLEKLTGGHMSAVPLELVMAESGTQHGSTVWRVSLQLGIGMREAMGLALQWKDMKERVGGHVVVRVERPEEDEAFTNLFNTEELIAPPAAEALWRECGAAGAVIGAAVGHILARHGANPNNPKAHDVPPDNRQAAIDELRQAAEMARHPPAQATPPPPSAAQQPAVPALPAPVDNGGDQNRPLALTEQQHYPPDAPAPPEMQSRLMKLNLRLDRIREILPGFNPQQPITVGECNKIFEVCSGS